MLRIKKYNPFVLLVFQMTFAGLFYSYGQRSIESELGNQLIEYGQNNFQEKIFVHTDKSFYVCGEIMWFKLYNTDAFLNKPATISKVAYVELLSNDHKPVLQAKIELNEGTGSGSFMLPYSLSSGSYVFRAYTNWMKNYSPDFYFESGIIIINTFKRLNIRDIESPEINIQFFPEGGDLVNNLESKIAFHAVDENGHGVACKGVILDQNKDTVTSFQSLRFGMGYFSFTPASGKKYKAVVQSESGIMITKDLPVALERGYVMKLDFSGEDLIKLNVMTNVHDNEPVYLLIHTRNIVKQALMKIIKNNVTEITIHRADFGEGISHLTLFNFKQQPVCERLFFQPPKANLNISIAPDRQEYPIRNKVNIGLNSDLTNGPPTRADISVSVFMVDSMQTVVESDIQNYLWLCSELRGTIESPSYYFNVNEKDAEEAADNLMLTQGWSRFKWEDVLNNKKSSFQFLPEYEGLQIRGEIKDKMTRRPLSHVTSYLTIPGKKFAFKSSTSDQSGIISFTTNKLYGTNKIIIQPVTKGIEASTIDISDAFSEKHSFRKFPGLQVNEKNKDLLVGHSIGSQVENVFVPEEKQKFTWPAELDTTAFYGKPDKNYLLDDYTRFITMEEVMREFVAEIRIRKTKDQFSLNVKNEPYHNFFENNPLVILDGLPIFDMNKVMELDPLKIKKLDIVTRKYFSGNDVIEGIVSFRTYNGDLEGFKINSDALLTEYMGLQLHREFYSPAYDTKERVDSRLPDFRNLLYWAPNVKTDKNGFGQVSFYTSDKPGRYAIVAQGINTDGVAGSSVQFFDVRK